MTLLRKARCLLNLFLALFGAFLLGVYWWFYEVRYGWFIVPVRFLPWYEQLMELGIPILLYLIIVAVVAHGLSIQDR